MQKSTKAIIYVFGNATTVASIVEFMRPSTMVRFTALQLCTAHRRMLRSAVEAKIKHQLTTTYHTLHSEIIIIHLYPRVAVCGMESQRSTAPLLSVWRRRRQRRRWAHPDEKPSTWLYGNLVLIGLCTCIINFIRSPARLLTQRAQRVFFRIYFSLFGVFVAGVATVRRRSPTKRYKTKFTSLTSKILWSNATHSSSHEQRKCTQRLRRRRRRQRI